MQTRSNGSQSKALKKGGFYICWTAFLHIFHDICWYPFVWLHSLILLPISYLTIQDVSQPLIYSIDEMKHSKAKKWDALSIFHMRHFFFTLFTAFSGLNTERLYECVIHWCWGCSSTALSSLCIRCVCLAHTHGCCLLSTAAVKVILLVAHLCARVHCCCTMFTSMLAVYLVVSFVLPTLSVHERMQAEDSIQCKKQSSQRGSFLWFTALLFFICMFLYKDVHYYSVQCVSLQIERRNAFSRSDIACCEELLLAMLSIKVTRVKHL